jgi:hypothetical protein
MCQQAKLFGVPDWPVGHEPATVWNRLYFRALAASFSKFGVWHGPPKGLDTPSPASSIKIASTLGAPSGGRKSWICAYLVSGSFTS